MLRGPLGPGTPAESLERAWAGTLAWVSSWLLLSSTLHVTLGNGSYPPTPPSPPPGQDQAAGELAQIGERSNFRSG